MNNKILVGSVSLVSDSEILATSVEVTFEERLKCFKEFFTDALVFFNKHYPSNFGNFLALIRLNVQ